MIKKTDIVFIISIIFKIITDQLGLIVILIIVCINSYYFYEYLVKLRTIKKKIL
jgi:hypothetical protein